MGVMREPTLLVLSALGDGPRHGYAVIQEVTRLSEGRVVLRPSTLYSALERLTGDGLVAVVREEEVNGRFRRYYELTPGGRDALAAEAARLEQNAAVARAAALRPAGRGARRGQASTS